MSFRFTILCMLGSTVLNAQSSPAATAIRDGNEYYKQKEFGRAAAEYGKALQAEPGNETAKFNQANTFYQQDQKVEAVQVYAALAREAATKNIRAGAYYNKGVILSQQKNLEESIEAYKNTLRLDPADTEARENLQKALLELKKKTPPPKEDKKQDKKKQDPRQQPQQQPQSKMSPKETEQRLRLLQQKEKEVQERLQRERSKSGGAQPKDW